MGLRYGLELNDSKLELLACHDNCEIDLGNGAQVKKKAGIIYLGALLTAGGKLQAELNRLMGGSWNLLWRINLSMEARKYFSNTEIALVRYLRNSPLTSWPANFMAERSGLEVFKFFLR